VGLRAVLVSLSEQVTGRSRRGLVLLFMAVTAVLLIVCANLANLLLARGAARRRELAIRMAVGANRRRLLRQMLTESALLAGCGGLFGVLLAHCLLRLMLLNAPAGLPRLDEVHIDARVLCFNGLVSVVATVLFGLVPAWRCSHVEPDALLTGGGRTITERRATIRLRSLLVSLEVGLSVGCLTVAGLLLHSFVNFGVVSYAVNQRRSEIGIRMALGASAAEVRRLVVQQGLQPVAWGLAAGLVLGLPARRLLQGLLIGVGTVDVSTIAGVIVLVLTVGVAACGLPVRRATRVDPVVALRHE
jgi:ABC-type antimicrobial peptide transport system permease subunit